MPFMPKNVSKPKAVTPERVEGGRLAPPEETRNRKKQKISDTDSQPKDYEVIKKKAKTAKRARARKGRAQRKRSQNPDVPNNQPGTEPNNEDSEAEDSEAEDDMSTDMSTDVEQTSTNVSDRKRKREQQTEAEESNKVEIKEDEFYNADWNTEELIKHLKKKFPREVDKEEEAKLRKIKITGYTFLLQRRNDLTDFDIAPGPASAFAKYITDVNMSQVIPGDIRQSYEDDDTNNTENSSDFNRDPIFISNERLNRIDRWLTNISDNSIACMRSPPASGKTTFTRLFQKHLIKKGRRVVRISMTDFNGPRTEKSFEEFWKQNSYFSWTSQAKMTWAEIYKCKIQTDVIIDEAQVLYKGMNFFWSNIKVLMQEQPNKNLRILFVSMYEDIPDTAVSTPLDFKNSLGLDDLRLQRDEFDILVDRYTENVQNNEQMLMNVSRDVRDTVFKSTGGHSGLVKYTLSLLKDRYRLGDRISRDIIGYLISPGYFSAIQATRSFIWLNEWKPTASKLNFLLYALCQITGSSFPVDLKDAEVAKELIRAGMITRTGRADSERLQFIAPLVRIILEKSIFVSRLETLDRSSDDFEVFLRLTIQRMRPSVLANSLSRSIDATNRLFERMWQMEWYRAATTAIPLGNTISPDVGAVFDSPGLLDFYVNGSLSWAVELLREGQKMQEHSIVFHQPASTRIFLSSITPS